MFEFGKNNTFIGVDVGTSAIKMVELKVEEGKPVLSNYAWMPLYGIEKINESSPDYYEAIVPAYVKRMIKEAGFSGKMASVAVPSFGGFVTLIDFPEVAQADMEQAVRYEAQKYIPTSLDEVALSWDLIKEESGNSGGLKNKVLLVAAPKSKVALYEKLIKNSGLKLSAVEIETFSLVTSLVGADPGRFIIVDIGSRVCNIVLVEKGIVQANRNLDAGGRDMTKTIAKSMGLDDKRAEGLKISGKNFFGTESYISFSTLDLIIGEISRVAGAYAKKKEENRIDSVILSGGTAGLSGINEYISNALGIKTITGNPFSRIMYDSKLQPQVDNLKAQFSVCIGLALREADNYLKIKSNKKL